MQPNVPIEKPSMAEGFLFEGSQGKGNGYGYEKFIGRALVLWASSVAAHTSGFCSLLIKYIFARKDSKVLIIVSLFFLLLK